MSGASLACRPAFHPTGADAHQSVAQAKREWKGDDLQLTVSCSTIGQIFGWNGIDASSGVCITPNVWPALVAACAARAARWSSLVDSACSTSKKPWRSNW
eukprot:COSAG01_NODE_8871_length_2631_cov_1.543049_2_plen_100_part_00